MRACNGREVAEGDPGVRARCDGENRIEDTTDAKEQLVKALKALLDEIEE